MMFLPVAWPWRDVADLHEVEVQPTPSFAKILGDLDAWGDTVIFTEELDAQAIAWRDLQDLKASITTIEAILAPKLHNNIPARPGWIETPIGVVKRTKKGGTTHWEDDKLLTTVVRTAVANRQPNGDGELPPPEDAAMAAVKACAGFNYWRVRKLAELGIEANEYREVSGGRPWVSRA